jgi:branched-chain amino acid transport system ATP-binding protein
MLEVERVNAGYGPVQVLSDISLDVKDGTIVSALGKNGAGKTT